MTPFRPNPSPRTHRSSWHYKAKSGTLHGPPFFSCRPSHRCSSPAWYWGVSFKFGKGVAHILWWSYPLQIVKPIIARVTIDMIHLPCCLSRRRSMKCMRNQAMDLEQHVANPHMTIPTWMQKPMWDSTTTVSAPSFRTHLPTTWLCSLPTIWWLGTGYNLHLQYNQGARQQANQSQELPFAKFGMLNRKNRHGFEVAKISETMWESNSNWTHGFLIYIIYSYLYMTWRWEQFP